MKTTVIQEIETNGHKENILEIYLVEIYSWYFATLFFKFEIAHKSSNMWHCNNQ